MTPESRRDYEADVLDSLKKALEAMREAREIAEKLASRTGLPGHCNAVTGLGLMVNLVKRHVDYWTPVAPVQEDSDADLGR